MNAIEYTTRQLAGPRLCFHTAQKKMYNRTHQTGFHWSGVASDRRLVNYKPHVRVHHLDGQ